MWPIRILFAVASLAIFGAATRFLYVRLVKDTTDAPAWRRLGASLLAAPFFLVPTLRFFLGRGMFTRVAATFFFAWWGVLLYTLLILLFLELAKRVRPAPTDPAKRLFLARAAAAGSLGLGSAVGSLGLYRALSEPQVTEVPIVLPGFPRALDGFTLVQLSDLHLGPVSQESFADLLVNAANRLHPDLVAITGDVVDGSPEEIGRFVAKLRTLSSRHGTFMVSGNHDYYSGWERWVPHFEQLGFQLLRNRCVRVGEGEDSFDLLGVEDWGGHRARTSPESSDSDYNLDQATRGRDRSRASVLLAHQPTNLEKVAAAGVGLQLSGHTHGGQLFPGTLIAEAIWGSAAAGLSKHGNLWQFTSRGCGFVGPPMRVGSPPEIVKIVLLAG